MKRTLQILLGILSLIPLIVVVRSFLLGTSWGAVDDAVSVDFESHYRYLSAFYIALPLFAWWMIPNVEKHTVPIRIIAFAIFLGGINRLVALLTVGVPSPATLAYLALELVFPLLAVLQSRLVETREYDASMAAGVGE